MKPQLDVNPPSDKPGISLNTHYVRTIPAILKAVEFVSDVYFFVLLFFPEDKEVS